MYIGDCGQLMVHVWYSIDLDVYMPYRTAILLYKSCQSETEEISLYVIISCNLL